MDVSADELPGDSNADPKRRARNVVRRRILLFFLLLTGLGFTAAGVSIIRWRSDLARLRELGLRPLIGQTLDRESALGEMDAVWEWTGWFARIEGIGPADDVDARLDKIDEIAKIIGRQGDGLKIVGMFDVPMTDAQFAKLPLAAEMHSVSLAGPEITDSSIERLAGCSRLHRLSLYFTGISDASLVQIGELPVHELSLIRADVSAAGLKSLRECSNLTELSLVGTPVTDVGMQHLGHCSGLTNLSLAHAGVTDEGLQSISRLPLERLTLSGAKVTDAGLVHLQRMPALKHLVLNGTAITDDGLHHLPGLPIEWLELAGTQVTDAGLETLKNLPKLEYLDLTKTRVNHQRARLLHEHFPDARILVGCWE